jgi:hypothetical protein
MIRALAQSKEQNKREDNRTSQEQSHNLLPSVEQRTQTSQEATKHTRTSQEQSYNLPVRSEFDVSAVAVREAKHAPLRRGVCRQELTHGDKVLERFRHFATADVQMTGVRKVIAPPTSIYIVDGGVTLRTFVRVVRELKIDACSVTLFFTVTVRFGHLCARCSEIV